MDSCGINCTVWLEGDEQRYEADPDIAGIGVGSFKTLLSRGLQGKGLLGS